MKYNYPKLYQRASEAFSRRVSEVKEADLTLPTPCAEWDVKQLLNHVTYEVLWVDPLLAGKTIAEIGDKFEGDVLGSKPVLSWQKAASGAEKAFLAVKDPGQVTHLSMGDTTAEEYARQMVFELLIHAWDLSKAIGTDTEFDTDLVKAAYAALKPEVENWRKAGVFGQTTVVSKDASLLDQLLSISGRRPSALYNETYDEN